MKQAFALPTTPTCRVVYEDKGVKYGAVIVTPHSNDELQLAMLAKKVGMGQVKYVEPIVPINTHRPSAPAVFRHRQETREMERERTYSRLMRDILTQ